MEGKRDHVKFKLFGEDVLHAKLKCGNDDENIGAYFGLQIWENQKGKTCIIGVWLKKSN